MPYLPAVFYVTTAVALLVVFLVAAPVLLSILLVSSVVFMAVRLWEAFSSGGTPSLFEEGEQRRWHQWW